MWDYRSQEWQERDKPASQWLKFYVPHELLPIELTRALLIVDVTGPVGRCELMGLARQREGNPEPVRIDLRRDPVGRVTFEILDGEVLKLGPDGTLVLGLSAGDPERPELTHPPDQEGKPSYWTIERLSLELWGTTQGMTNGEARKSDE